MPLPDMYAYDDITETCSPGSVLQRACTYLYDALVLPYLAQTYTTTTTLIVITGAYRSASTPTPATAHCNSKSSNKQGISSISSGQPAACGLQSAVSLYDYDTTMAAYEAIDATTLTTTHTYTQSTNQTPQRPAKTATTTHDAEYYYGLRYYSPELGRWINRDPIGEWGGGNLHGFLGNRPVYLVDLLGAVAYVYAPNDHNAGSYNDVKADVDAHQKILEDKRKELLAYLDENREKCKRYYFAWTYTDYSSDPPGQKTDYIGYDEMEFKKRLMTEEFIAVKTKGLDLSGEVKEVKAGVSSQANDWDTSAYWAHTWVDKVNFNKVRYSTPADRDAVLAALNKSVITASKGWYNGAASCKAGEPGKTIEYGSVGYQDANWDSTENKTKDGKIICCAINWLAVSVDVHFQKAK